MSAPISISAVESNRLSIFYYRRENGSLATLTARKSGEDPSDESYATTTVLLDGNTVHPAALQISAVSYTRGNNREVSFVSLLLLTRLPISLSLSLSLSLLLSYY
jgi:hypothetical protein